MDIQLADQHIYRLDDRLTPDEIKAIQRFVIDHAADSEQPATCG